MAQSMRGRAVLKDGVTEVKILLRHQMETGQRKDAEGNTIPAHFITEVTAMLGDRLLMHSFWGAAVSQNPSLAFQFEGGASGDVINLSWIDNRGAADSGDVKIR